MRIFIAGGTGVLGRRLVAHLSREGHHVTCLVRESSGEQLIRSLGAEPRYADLLQADTVATAMDAVDLVIHAAASVPAKPRLEPSDFDVNDRLCREGTRTLAVCAGANGAKAFLQLSTIRVALPKDGADFDETSPPSTDRFAAAALEGEQIAGDTARAYGFTHSVLRCAPLYGPDVAETRMLAGELCQAKVPIIGTGEAYWCLLHIEDAASAFARAVERPIPGIWHVADNRPVSMREFLAGFARRLEAPTPGQVPEFLARMVAGDCTVTLLTSSTRTSNARFCRAFGWAPKFSTFDEGLDDIVSVWRSDGFFGQLGHQMS